MTLLGCGHAGLNLIEAGTIAVNGVAIGAPPQDVVARLGEPRSRESGYDDLMGMGRWETLLWPGLEVQVIQPEPEQVPHVARVTITGRSWRTAAGLRVGDSMDDVRRLLGPPERMGAEPGEDPFWYYLTATFDGSVVVIFRDRRVVEIRIAEDWT